MPLNKSNEFLFFQQSMNTRRTKFRSEIQNISLKIEQKKR